MNHEKISKAISDFVEANDGYTRLVNEIIVNSRKICREEYQVLLSAFVRQKKALDDLRETLYEFVADESESRKASKAMALVADIWSARDGLIDLAECAREIVDAQIKSDTQDAISIDSFLLTKLGRALEASQQKLFKLEGYKPNNE